MDSLVESCYFIGFRSFSSRVSGCNCGSDALPRFCGDFSSGLESARFSSILESRSKWSSVVDSRPSNSTYNRYRRMKEGW